MASNSDKSLPTTSTAGAASQYTSYGFEQQSDSTSTVHPTENEGEVSDQETSIPEQNHAGPARLCIP